MGLPNLSGQHVGPYKLTQFIAVGGNGTVHRAVDTTSNDAKSYALKCVPKKKSSRRRYYQFVTEIISHDAASECAHVLPLRDIVEADRCLFLVLDLADMDMHRAIWEKSVYWMDGERIKRAFVEILDGVMACHDRGIFHRDLKPKNIMCNADGTGIQIGDFGWATFDRLCRDGGCGTPSYMSPECWMCKEGEPYYGSLTDVWSLGVILFNMVTNCRPWEAALPSDVEFAAFMVDEDHLLRTYAISESLSAMLKWILHPTPGMRLPVVAIREAVQRIDTFYNPVRSA